MEFSQLEISEQSLEPDADKAKSEGETPHIPHSEGGLLSLGWTAQRWDQLKPALSPELHTPNRNAQTHYSPGSHNVLQALINPSFCRTHHSQVFIVQEEPAKVLQHKSLPVPSRQSSCSVLCADQAHSHILPFILRSHSRMKLMVSLEKKQKMISKCICYLETKMEIGLSIFLP